MLRGGTGRPAGDIPVVAPVGPRSPAAALAVTWFGHSTALVEIDGYRVLTDPVWSDRCSPSRRWVRSGCIRRRFRWSRCRRWMRSSSATITTTISTSTPCWRSPALSARRSSSHSASEPTCAAGVSPTANIEFDWNERIRSTTYIGVHARPAFLRPRLVSQHDAVGLVGDRGTAAPCLLRRRHRLHRELRRIGAEHGPFDLTLMPVGAYNPLWPDIHMNPEEAVQRAPRHQRPACSCRSTGAHSGLRRIRGQTR